MTLRNASMHAVCLTIHWCIPQIKISAMTRGIICRDIWDLWNGIPDFCNFAAFRKVPRTSASMFEHVHVALQLHRSRMVADQMYAAGLAFARLHLILAKKSFELLGDIGDTRVIKEKHPSCFETLNILSGWGSYIGSSNPRSMPLGKIRSSQNLQLNFSGNKTWALESWTGTSIQLIIVKYKALGHQLLEVRRWRHLVGTA